MENFLLTASGYYSNCAKDKA